MKKKSLARHLLEGAVGFAGGAYAVRRATRAHRALRPHAGPISSLAVAATAFHIGDHIGRSLISSSKKKAFSLKNGRRVLTKKRAKSK
jgi:hypothetical protein